MRGISRYVRMHTPDFIGTYEDSEATEQRALVARIKTWSILSQRFGTLIDLFPVMYLNQGWMFNFFLSIMTAIYGKFEMNFRRFQALKFENLLARPG